MPRQIDKEARSGFTLNATTGYNTISGTAEHDYLLLDNPTGSGKGLLITHFLGDIDSVVSRCIFRVYSMPTVTANGTAITLVNGLVKASAPGGVAKAYRDPTISVRGGLLALRKISPGAGSYGQTRRFWVESDSRILITVQNSISMTNTFAQIYWLEI